MLMRTLLCALAGLFVSPLAAAEVPALENPGLEQTEPGRAPAGWALRPRSQAFGYQARVSAERPHGGRRCLELELPTSPLSFGHFGLVTQSLPAVALRGKRVRFRAAVRAEVPASAYGAALYARVLRPGFRPGHSDDMADRTIRHKEWKEHHVVIDVAADAERLEVGFLLTSPGKAWFDDAALEVIGRAGAGNEPPRPLAGRGRDNLVALARLLGVVRYFHPSDGVAAADWGRFAVEAIPVVEPARSPEDLAARLTELFAPLAPAVQVFPVGQAPKAAPGLAAPPGAVPSRVVAWRHVGVAPHGPHGTFRSERMTDRELAGAAKLPLGPEPLPKPGEPYEVALGGGVACRVPLALYGDARGTLPRATATPRAPAKPADFPPTGDDRSTRLADVILAWNVFQHFYPYFDAVETDWPAALREALTAAATDRAAAAFYDTLKRLVALAHDSHGTVRGGSGTAVPDGALPLAWDWVEDRLVVVNADREHAGRVKPGDVVRAIDRVAAEERLKAAERLVSGATPQFRRYRAMQELRNGPAGQPVTLELRPFKGAVYTVTLRRRPADDSPLRGPNLREWRLPRLAELKPGFLYVDLDRYTPEEFYREAAPKVFQAKGVVFDVRGYPLVPPILLAALSDRPLRSDHFQDVIARFPDRQRVSLEDHGWTLPPGRRRLKAKAAFLSDGRAVSYAETFLSLVANHKLAPIVGGPTAGSNGTVNVYALPGGYRVSWTGLLTTRLDGTRFHGVGVRPTVPTHRTIRAVAEGRDEVLEKALELVRE
jgi:hypothetical protein